ncbi:hypothetical protein BOVMAS03_16500 [Streptococcus uberis]|uniref:hypothetical protein n=1 Tax=Streptococcus uberis TaxID=1349 RepID=UPI00333E4028
MGVVAKVTFFFFVLGLLILSLDIDFVYDIFTKFEKIFIPKNKNDQKLRPFLFIFYIGRIFLVFESFIYRCNENKEISGCYDCFYEKFVNV